MSSIVDERGFNQGFKLSQAQAIRLHRRAQAIASEMRFPSEATDRDSIRILELGCGTGELTFELAKLTGAQITGIDLSKKFITRALATYQHPQLRFRVADLKESLPELESNAYHYIVGNGILHHLYGQLEDFLPRLKGWLVSGGKLIFWEPNLTNPYVLFIFTIPILRRLARLEPGEMAFTPDFIKRKLLKAGFCDVRAVARDFLIPHTPASLIDTVVKVGERLERLHVVRSLAQSVFLTATKAVTSEHERR
jgi:2-polyprenyl-3-methyl-5-hydroxy-6-metoxy-1,4-benzoquinol methylase